MFYLELTGDVVGQTNGKSWIRTTDTSLGVSFESCLRRRGRRTDGTSLLCPIETSSHRSNNMSRRHNTETSWRLSIETYLRRRRDILGDVVTPSPRRLVAGWVNGSQNMSISITFNFKQ